MPANEKIAKLDPGAGDVTVEITFGYAQRAVYDIFLWDADSTNLIWRSTPSPGFSYDALPDRFILSKPPGEMNHFSILWRGIVSSGEPVPGEFYSVTVMITQGGAEVPGGHIVNKGPLENTEAFMDYVRLIV